MRRLIPYLLLLPALSAAQGRPSGADRVPAAAGTAIPAADSALLYDVLRAEDRRDPSATALAAAAGHPNPRLSAIARRAIARMADSTFAERPALGQPDPARPVPHWPEPEWADRYRALGGRDGDCAPLLAALSDPAAQVRQRAIVLGGQRRSCIGDAALRERLLTIMRDGATDVARRAPPNPSWQLAADAIVTLARIAPNDARNAAQRFARHRQPQLRRAAARAATVLRDSTLLLRLVDDRDGNVAEAALRGVAQTHGRAADDRYRRLLGSGTPQVALAAAEALKGTSDAAALRDAQAELQRRIAHNWASERDIRNALRAVIGEAPSEAWQPGRPDSLPWDVVGLALGQRRYVEVTMSRRHGGGAFIVELRGDLAPIQTARVLAHLRAGRYDGTSWHRVEPNFVVQGGSPHHNEYSGSGRFIVDELGTLAHPRGSVGMSTRGHSTGDLQWFVNLRDNARLVRDYTVFGVVVAGMEVVDELMEGDEIARMREVSAPRPDRP